jgi:hypothetical protein
MPIAIIDTDAADTAAIDAISADAAIDSFADEVTLPLQGHCHRLILSFYYTLHYYAIIIFIIDISRYADIDTLLPLILFSI